MFGCFGYLPTFLLARYRAGRCRCAKGGARNVRRRRQMIAHALAQHRRLLVVRYREVPVCGVLGRRHRHVEALGVLQAPLLQLQPAEHRDEHEEHYDAHEAAHDQTEATRQNRVDEAARGHQTVLVQRQADVRQAGVQGDHLSAACGRRVVQRAGDGDGRRRSRRVIRPRLVDGRR